MERISSQITFLILVVLQLCDAVTEIKANRLVTYDGLSCPQTDILFVQTGCRTRIECIAQCSEASDCACVFYMQGYCQGCKGLCHHGAALPALAGTTYYFLNKKPAISFASGGFTFDDKYYLIVNINSTWYDALSYCNSLQATLIYIETHTELQFIAQQLATGYNYWTGGILSGDQYIWQHSGAPVNMTLFAPGQPDGAAGVLLCARFWSPGNFMLDDYYCYLLGRFICKSF